MKKISFKGRKHAVTATCLLVGMFMLTSAVYANYDDAKGYTNYKNAMKKLAFYEENFTVEGKATMLIDDEAFTTMNVDAKMDGKNTFMHTKNTMAGDEDNTIESFQWQDGKTFYSYNPEANTYYTYESSGSVRPDMSDPTMKKAIRFTELLADAMVGDLKNNFVLTSGENGNKSYSVNISGSQIPEVINAGLSLMFTAANDASNIRANSYVTYENHMKAFGAFYEEKTGKTFEQSTYNSTWDEEMEKVNDEFYEKYNDVLESHDNVGIVHVKADGSYDYYKNYEEYTKNVKLPSVSEDQLFNMLGTDPYIDNATCNFTLDKDGKFISNEMSASMVGVDDKGKKHSITIKGEFNVKDYGTTKVEKFDTTGKIKN
ncbi:MAG: hypothetical protein ACK5MV_10705 [Aminipila sp.]